MSLFTVLSNGTASANFKELEKKARGMSVAELMYASKDCREAADAMPEGCKAGFYLDCVHVYGGEIHRRRKGSV